MREPHSSKPLESTEEAMHRIETPFGFYSTADEVVAGIDLSGQRAIVTGGSSGIGIETARSLAAAGAEVTLAVRNTDAGARVAADITASTGNNRVRVSRLDLVDCTSIARFVSEWNGPLHILINNAGAILQTLERTAEGWEKQFAMNHLGHFALAVGLHDALVAAGEARIVAVSSSGHLYSPVVFDDIHFAYRPYGDMLAYGQSKTANVLFTVGATARWAKHGITANAAMPGSVHTNFVRNMDPDVVRALLSGTGLVGSDVPLRWKTPQQGAATSVLLATSPLLKSVGGRYFEDCNEAVHVADNNGYVSGVAPYALDPANAARLWEESQRLLA
jgi:NAD(P)-dependent dehydrogenase (short-subunit alcohol dehydrogenase family)